MATKKEIIGLYKLNKRARVRDTIFCPSCGVAFMKRQYSQAFCCIECKDRYWNMVRGNRHRDPNYYRKRNARIYAENREYDDSEDMDFWWLRT